MKIHLDIMIKAPQNVTYKLFADVKNAGKNIKAIEKIEIINDSKDFVGTRWRETRTEFGKQATVEMWVQDAKENEFYTVESVDHGTHYTSRYDFKPIDENTTQVLFTFEGKPQTLLARLMSLMFLVFAGTLKKSFMKDMVDLKNILES